MELYMSIFSHIIDLFTLQLKIHMLSVFNLNAYLTEKRLVTFKVDLALG